ncbi:LOW QUALITY PROTEIN: serine/threonine-protein kinase 17B-like [Haliotis rubra]|uniref:LOW QUALITY PROTEIN: serine/threonine-protein kinase 17B-like n=1 Tax=Haliotis rubra TaxID=36100 RepID=UPI001EE5B1ED|nr:LOW QUALITY PROTEIN: serine/threonine-protein kinase 17B-like [Haliotis rubra]
MLSMNGLKVANYVPNSTIKTEPLTSKYTIQGSIGRGKFAVVKKCVNNETGDTVAAKFIRKRRKGKSCREEILREVVMLELALAHPRLVDLLEVYETPSELILVTEYCAGGELFHECVIEESFKEADVVRLMIQILEGLTYLHERNIVHLDLKPQNILFTKPYPEGDIKICDLGFACLVNTGEDIRDIIGTPDYVAPEVLDYEPLNTMTDMWSMGVLAYVMLSACAPFAGENNQETFCNISQVKLDFPPELFGETSDQAQDFISCLLVKNPRKRLTARQCLDHQWLKTSVDNAGVPLLPSPSDAAFGLSQDLGSTVNYHSQSRENQENLINGKQLKAASTSMLMELKEKDANSCLNHQKSTMSNADKRRSMEIPLKKLRSDDNGEQPHNLMCEISAKAVKDSVNMFESTRTYNVQKEVDLVCGEHQRTDMTSISTDNDIDSNILHVSPLEQDICIKSSPD